MFLTRPDSQQTADALRAWLGTKLLGVKDLVVSEVVARPSRERASNVVGFRADWTRNGVPGGADYVAKISPWRGSGFPGHGLVTEQLVMQALSVHSAAPVPAAPWVETDPGVLGGPFLVLERPPGCPASRLPDLSAEQRAVLVDNALVVLAQIHAVDHVRLGLDFLDRAEQGTSGPAVLTWGSARLSNMLFSEDLSVSAVLNWERACLGPPELDLAELLHSCRAFANSPATTGTTQSLIGVEQ